MKSPSLPPFAAVLGLPTGLVWLAVALAGLLLVAGLVALWLLFGRGPRRARGYRRAMRQLRQGHWQDALRQVRELQESGRHSRFWEGRLRNAEGECRRAAGVEAVQAGEFEKALEHHLRAAELLNLNTAEVQASIVERMLGEVRRLFAADTSADTTGPVQQMIGRILVVKQFCPEAYFWQGLCHVREGQLDLAVQALQTARAQESPAADAPARAAQAGPFIDPPLYLGGVLLRQGQAKEGLRHISEANRIDANCALVALELGIAMVAAGSDGNLATRALQRALGMRNLPVWYNQPERAWSEGMPEGRSYVRKLANKHTFVCPLWGTDLRAQVSLAQLSLGQAYYRMEQFQQAAESFQKLINDTAPTHDALRWLGLALTRLQRYDEAFKHLKTAYDLEEPKDRLTAGYLALCAACGKPSKPENKPANVAWAVQTVRRYEGLGDREWVRLIGQVFAEALKLNMALSGEDQVFLCDHLVSVQATDRDAAMAYHHVALEYPGLLKPVYAWLYCRAAVQHNIEHERSLDLFARTFQTGAEGRTFFARYQWDFEELEFAFLRQAAVKEPGTFPAVLGPDYPVQGEAMLLERSQRLEQENKPDAALACVDVLARLAPRSVKAQERLALLYYRRTKLDRAADWLRTWSQTEPDSAVPLARLAVVVHKQGQTEEALTVLRSAIERKHGRQRADLACLAARLALAGVATPKGGSPLDGAALRGLLERARGLLDIALAADGGHAQAMWLMAAVRALAGDRAGLAAQSAAMRGPATNDPYFHYFAAVSHLTAGDHAAALDATARTAGDPALKIEGAYLQGWAHLHRGDADAAVQALRTVAQVSASPSTAHARALLGCIRFHQGSGEEAVQWWQGLDAERRTAWKLAEPLQSTLFLAGLQAIQAGRFEQAAEKLREAGKAGLRERRLGPLVQYALVKAGQQLLYRDRG
jgi:tetratricopeptide (TPR) repeat protein